MLWKRSFVGMAKFLFAAMILCAVTCAVMGQDSKPAAGTDIWKDSATGLTWALKDNGSAVSPNQAGSYCTSLQLGGFSDWRLATIDELEAFYDSKASKKDNKTKGPVQLSASCVLSGTTNASGEVWSFCFNNGARMLGGNGCGTSGIALCVRGPAK